MYKAMFIFPSGVIQIEDDGQIEIDMATNGKMSADELAAAATISEVLARLRNGKFVNFDIKIDSYQDSTAIVKCEWLPRSNNLKIHGPTDKERDHATTVEEAINKHRTFTCPQAISVLLPKKRTYKPDTGVSSGN